MITLNIDPSTFFFWLAIASMLVNVALIIALYRLANAFMLVGELVGISYPKVQELAEAVGKPDAAKFFNPPKFSKPLKQDIEK